MKIYVCAMTLDRDRCGTSIRVQNRLNLPNPTAVGFKIALFIFHHILGGNSLNGPFLMSRPICITKIHQWTPINVIDALMRTHSLNSDVVGYIYTIFGNIFTSGFSEVIGMPAIGIPLRHSSRSCPGARICANRHISWPRVPSYLFGAKVPKCALFRSERTFDYWPLKSISFTNASSTTILTL